MKKLIIILTSMVILSSCATTKVSSDYKVMNGCERGHRTGARR